MTNTSNYIEAVGQIVEKLEGLGLTPVLVGGMALVILGSRRVTQDFDILMADNKELQGKVIDLLFDFPLPAHELAARSQKKKVRSYTFCVASKKDLIRLKEIAYKDRSLATDVKIWSFSRNRLIRKNPGKKNLCNQIIFESLWDDDIFFDSALGHQIGEVKSDPLPPSLPDLYNGSMKTIMALVFAGFLLSGVATAQKKQLPVDTQGEATDSESHRDLIRDTNPEQDNDAAALDNNDAAINLQRKSDIDNSDVDNSDTEPQNADIDNSDVHY